MALSSILSIGLHLTIFLFFYYGLPFSKIKDRKQYQSLFLEISKKTNLSTNELEYKSGVILKKILHQYIGKKQLYI